MKRVGVVCCTCKVWNERDMAEWPCLPDLGSGVGEKIAFLYLVLVGTPSRCVMSNKTRRVRVFRVEWIEECMIIVGYPINVLARKLCLL